MKNYTLDLVYPYGEPSLSGLIKQNLEDFKVFEKLGFEPTGEGEHLYLYIEKKDTTTDSVTQSLARFYGVKPYHVADCGLKDAKAVTRQWFSVHLPGMKAFPDNPVNEDFKILNRDWSLKKLKKGVHQGNYFELIVTHINGDISLAIQQIEHLKKNGFANYFGEQRFGKGKKNVFNAMDAFINGKKLSRSKRSLYLSSLRSYLFNRVLRDRIDQYGSLKPLEGDCFMLNGSRSTFCETLSGAIFDRFYDNDIHPIISLQGRGESMVSGLAAELENKVNNDNKDMLSILIAEGMQRDKRSIRQSLESLNYEFINDSLKIQFYLPKGCYATTVLQHFSKISLS